MANLSNDMRMICEVIGDEATRKLMRQLGGISIYIPKPGREEIMEALKQNAHNTKMVAAMYGISQRKVEGIHKELRMELRQNEFDRWQRSLFDQGPKTDKEE